LQALQARTVLSSTPVLQVDRVHSRSKNEMV
jgi:hypothetical protein